ncbi:MAG: NADH-quinone oxidoreductase subunit J [Alphaproteobacteria bacterium]|nr:NADH-quinone oxidoreductase subunit J [Alphaproteobacteria bacterium]
MTADVTSILFYVFASVLMLAALAVITAKNPVHSVFFLILGFFNAAGLFVLLGAEYIAMTLVIVYVGAVAVLFLFVVMMLNINFEKLRGGFASHLPLGVSVAALLFAELAALLYGSILTPAPLAVAANPIPDVLTVGNTQAIGRVLYTDYLIAFQLAGIILLVAMIGAIVITHRERLGVRRQNIVKQLARTRAQSVALVNVKPGEGI